LHALGGPQVYQGLNCTLLCPICNNEIETLDHAMMELPNARKYGLGSRMGINCEDININLK